MNSGYKISALDYLLIGAGTTLATLAAGFGLAIPGIGYTFATIIAIGTFISGFIRFNANHDKKWLDKDWIGFIAAAIIVIIFVVPLNKMLPEGGFPFKLIVASGLCWLLSFWSLFMWRDSSLLFPAVPAVALFSLVGSWDSFGGATFFFFGFMLCFATLFARSQMRLMVYRAELAGFTSIDQLIKGPWKWVAGPEWALASAVAMIGISLVFAPFFQKSVQSVAGFAKASGSVVKPSSAGPMPTFNNPAVTNEFVGRGPHEELSQRPIILARMDNPSYLRAKTFDIYTGRGWSVTIDFFGRDDRGAAVADPNSLMNVGRQKIVNGKVVPVEIECLAAIGDSLPLPGALVYLDTRRDFLVRRDGTVNIQGYSSTPPPAFAQVLVPNPDARPKDSTKGLETAYYRKPDSLKVRQFAEEAIAEAKTDFEKAEAIKRSIATRCTYNLQATALPREKDAVEAFLFDTKEGYCDLFASAMVESARAVGLPARYVTGFYPFSGDVDAQSRFIIKDSDFHAWCEVLFDDVGWVVFDATEGAAEIDGNGLGTPVARTPWYRHPLAMWVLSFLGGATLLLMIASSVRKAWLNRMPKNQDLVYSLARRFQVKVERKVKQRRWPSQTPDEFFRKVKGDLGETAPSYGEINETLVQFLYGPRVLTPLEFKDLTNRIAKL